MVGWMDQTKAAETYSQASKNQLQHLACPGLSVLSVGLLDGSNEGDDAAVPDARASKNQL